MTINQPTKSACVTIFEGPDGSGKSTAARWFADTTGARYVHLNAFPNVDCSLASLYVQAMLPALLGYQDVVLDRSWISEPVYGVALRGGDDRIGPERARMLERVALRCGAVVVRCNPGLETILANWRARKGIELVQEEDTLTAVAWRYAADPTLTGLHAVDYDYTADELRGLPERVDELRYECHPASVASAGALPVEGFPKRNVLLVGERFTGHKSWDALYQAPFVSFMRAGSSWWLTRMLSTYNIGETDLCWANADQDLRQLPLERFRAIVALGNVAVATVREIPGDYDIHYVPHPMHWARFRSSDPYPLGEAFKRIFP